MSNQFNASNLMFNVYQTKRGGFGIRLIAPPSRLGKDAFVICSYLDEVSGEALFGSHPILGSKWAAVKEQLIRAKQDAGILERVQAEPITPSVPAPEVKRGPGRPRKTRIAAESVTPVAPAPVAPAPVDLHQMMGQLIGEVATLKQAMGVLLAPRK